jgi:hypothetical protein
LHGPNYVRIHACVNDCVLFRGEFADLSECPKCGEARYRRDVSSLQVPRKVLQHFPVIPRLRMMFQCRSTASLMDWHLTHQSQDGKWRIPADSPAWQHIGSTWPEFRDEPRYLRLGLGTDGVNPFGLRSSSYSICKNVRCGSRQEEHSRTRIGSRETEGDNAGDGQQVYKELTITTCEPCSLLYKSFDRTDRSTPTPLPAHKELPTQTPMEHSMRSIPR